jgi:signal transduction histidine kinase
MLSTSAAANNISIIRDIQMDSPVLILEDDLYEILFNLVENAIKYNVPGGTITIRLLRDGENALIQVSDTGMGVPEDAIPHLFERFYRVDKARSRETGGTGLGLAITKNVILLHHGAVRVESKEGEGTIFLVRIPLIYIS